MEVRSMDKEYVLGTYGRFDVLIVKGKGSLMYDENGKEYIDMGSGIAVNTFGVADDEWIGAVTAQLSSLQHCSNLYYSSPCVSLAQLLCERTGMSKVFFCNSGAEANECAIKAARKHGEVNKGKDHYTVITLKNSFHGRTITTLSATGQDVFHESFFPMTEGFIHVEANNISELEKAVSENKVAAVMIECVQGEGGVNALQPDYVKAVRRICDENDLLMIVDEVQTGNGRTGKLYSYMNFGVVPDVFTTAKGLGGGLPIGACIMNEKTSKLFTPGSNGSTFGGNPVVCAGAYNIISRIDDEFLSEVDKKSKYVIDRLSSCSGVESVTGMGLMLGIKTKKDAGEVIKKCIENGVLVIKAKNKVRLLPPLNIPMELLERAMDVIIDALK